jgi:hypothetical protein
MRSTGTLDMHRTCRYKEFTIEAQPEPVGKISAEKSFHAGRICRSRPYLMGRMCCDNAEPIAGYYRLQF